MFPFAALPYGAGAVVWNLANSLVLLAAVQSLPGFGERAGASSSGSSCSSRSALRRTRRATR